MSIFFLVGDGRGRLSLRERASPPGEGTRDGGRDAPGKKAGEAKFILGDNISGRYFAGRSTTQSVEGKKERKRDASGLFLA